jgi:hypothetical protein
MCLRIFCDYPLLVGQHADVQRGGDRQGFELEGEGRSLVSSEDIGMHVVLDSVRNNGRVHIPKLSGARALLKGTFKIASAR